MRVDTGICTNASIERATTSSSVSSIPMYHTTLTICSNIHFIARYHETDKVKRWPHKLPCELLTSISTNLKLLSLLSFTWLCRGGGKGQHIQQVWELSNQSLISYGKFRPWALSGWLDSKSHYQSCRLVATVNQYTKIWTLSEIISPRGTHRHTANCWLHDLDLWFWPVNSVTFWPNMKIISSHSPLLLSIR